MTFKKRVFNTESSAIKQEFAHGGYKEEQMFVREVIERVQGCMEFREGEVNQYRLHSMHLNVSKEIHLKKFKVIFGFVFFK